SSRRRSASGAAGRDADAGFEACEASAETGVDADAERQVAIVAPADVEPIGVGELGRIAVRGNEPEDAEVALGDALAAQLAGGRRRAPSELRRALVAHELIEGGGEQRRVVLQVLPLLRVTQQREHAIADQVVVELHSWIGTQRRLL